MKLLLRILSCALVAFLTLEACARLEDFIVYRAPLLGSYGMEDLFQSEGDTLYGKPGARYQKWRLNSLGYRGPEPAPNSLHVVCFGSSETFGLYEREGGEWPRELELVLNASHIHRRVSVINAAYAGMNVRTYRLHLRHLLRQIHPDAVVIYPSLANYIRVDMMAQLRPALPPPGWTWRIESKLWETGKRILPVPLQDWLRELSTRQNVERDRIQVIDKIPETNAELFRTDIEGLLDDLAAAGVPAVLVTHATRFTDPVSPADRPFLIAWRRFYPVLAENGFLDMEHRLNGVLRKTASDRRIPLVDADRKLPKGAASFVEFVHFNDEGAKALAQLVAPAVNEILSK